MHKFKVGDIVRVIPSTAVSWRLRQIIGRDVEVSEVSSSGYGIFIKGLDGGGVSATRFELVRRPSPADEIKVGTYIISLQKPDGTLLPAEKPKQYSSDEQADKIAKLMAKRHGGRFVVFKAVSQYEMPVAEPVYRAL